MADPAVRWAAWSGHPSLRPVTRAVFDRLGGPSAADFKGAGASRHRARRRLMRGVGSPAEAAGRPWNAADGGAGGLRGLQTYFLA